MATVYKQGSGFSIQVKDGKRRLTKRLGKLSAAGARDVKHYANIMETCNKSATHFPVATITWLEEIGDDLHAALAGVGLCPARTVVKDYGIAPSIPRIIQDHLERRQDLRPFTSNNYKQAKLRAESFFGAKPANQINEADAKDFKRWCLNQGYAQATTAGYVNKIRHLLNDAVDRGVIPSNAFRKVAGGTQVNEERQAFISRDTMAKVIAATTDPEWKNLFAFARYAGVRVPSEIAGLTIADVDFQAGRVVIHSPKTRQHGKAKRTIPLFPELRQPLADAVARAKAAGTAKLFPTIRAEYNPHTQAVRLIKDAGVPVWQKVFQNLRSTRETELLMEGNRLEVVCRWIGNSPAVAMRHYLQITGEDWERATGAAKSAALLPGQDANNANDEKQNPRYLQINAGDAVSSDVSMPRSGVQQSPKTVGKSSKPVRRAAQSAANRRGYHLPEAHTRRNRILINKLSRTAARRKAGAR